MIDFVKEHIIYRFGIPHTVTTDQVTMSTSREFDEFASPRATSPSTSASGSRSER
jgi:hypothetical protein